MFTNVQATSMQLSWTPPIGGAHTYLVIVRAGSVAPTYRPANGTTPAGINSNLTLASDQGGGDRVVYDSAAPTVTITGLQAQTPYTVVIIPANGSGTARSYRTALPLQGSRTTASVPVIAVTPSMLSFGSVTIGSVSTQSITVAGTSLTAPIVLSAAPAQYSLSLAATPFVTQATISLATVNGVVAPTTVFVRVVPSTLGAIGGTITAASGAAPAAATSQTVAVQTTGLPLYPRPVLTALSTTHIVTALATQATTLTLTGSGFVQGATLWLAGQPLAATALNVLTANQATATLSTDALAQIHARTGGLPSILTVWMENPAPSLGTSNTLTLQPCIRDPASPASAPPTQP